ncbi:hypothetical protein BRADI_1g05198v3 [Brachypodium distachyon]|uniref:GRF-type domain-containing protein n=1 Tax=Brachypodium distachyon TaxID=15368 RepID=A0A0Q3JKI4_BRADI|nr:hypothetical protein BRADI_1g05198v3 [Brachypodium distachyon]
MATERLHLTFGPLPLINCTSCGFRRVKRYTSSTEENKDRDFVKCINHGPKFEGCDFWYWIDEYANFAT